ncbi:MAG: excinuclease ABC subunit UvrC [Candidatus Ancillula sp.]|jgi:excinuclease ABC subunit C|nr:excinuclease ABC subunit UvrC [Candidatus Ancillula sp.]
MSDLLSGLPKVSDIPSAPGVYKWRDENQRVIYVGKAKNLKQRLSSYFAAPGTLHPRTAKMISMAQSLEWTIVGNDIEALTLEYAWIKEFEPRFNVIFRNDDKSYPYLCVTSDEFPRVFVTRRRRDRKNRYFGPYPKSFAIRETFSVLQETYQLRNCTNSVFNSARRTSRPCLLGFLDKCSKPCVGEVTLDDYDANLKSMLRFLKGDIKDVKDRLTQKMHTLAEETQFELAAKKRDQLNALEVIIESNTVEIARTDSLDVYGAFFEELEAGMHIFHIQHGIIIGEEKIVAERGLDQTDAEMVTDLLLSQYSINDIPHEIIVPVELDFEPLRQILEQKRGTNVDIRVAERGAKRDLMQKATLNAEETLRQSKMHRTTDLESRTNALNEIHAALGLAKVPLRIECYDISHLMGEHQTGAQVVFEEGLPKKKDYRLYNLRGDFISWDKNGVPDDTAAVYEVIRRRLEYVKKQDNKFANVPQLLLIDGGKPQVNAAFRAVQDAGMSEKIEVASIAKRLEEVWRPNLDLPVILPRHSLSMYLLQALRDEAHRFSIVSMRKRRSKAFFS